MRNITYYLAKPLAYLLHTNVSFTETVTCPEEVATDMEAVVAVVATGMVDLEAAEANVS